MAQNNMPPWMYMQAQASQVDEPGLTPDVTDEEMMLSQLPPGVQPVQVPATPQEAKSMGLTRTQFKTIQKTTRPLAGPMSQQQVTPQQQLMDLAKSYELKQRELLNQQQSGLSQLQGQINEYAQAPMQYDPRYLAAFADIGDPEGHWLQRANQMPLPTETAQERKLNVLKLQEMLQKRKEDLTKTEAAALQAQINAYKNAKDDSLQKEKTMAQIDWYKSGNRQALQDQRLDTQVHNQVINKVTNDKILGQRITQVQNLDNALAAFKQGTATPQQFAELQQAVRANLGIKGGSGVGEREETYLKSLGLGAAQVKQFITGNPQDVTKYVNPEMIKHVERLVDIEKGNVRKQADQRLKAITAGHESVYKRNPALRQDLNIAVQHAGEQFGPSQQSSQYQEGDVVDYDGKTYRLQGDHWVEVGQ